MRTKVEIENHPEKMKDKVTRLTETTKEEMMRTEVEIKTKTGETAETTTENIVRLINNNVPYSEYDNFEFVENVKSLENSGYHVCI